MTEQRKLEEIWAGEFGDSYLERNIDAHANRGEFWTGILERIPVGSALEVGCNVGANLVWLADMLGTEKVAGVDVSEKALEVLRERRPGIDVRRASALELPFRDGEFDLAFTIGVLIHIHPDALGAAMDEVVRCARRWVLCGEYYSEQPEEVPYRGLEGALFKRDFGAAYQERFPDLRLVEDGPMSAGDSSGNPVNYWLFEKPAPG